MTWTCASTGSGKVTRDPLFTIQLRMWIADVLDRVRPADRSRPLLASDPDEDELDRLCVVLAWCEVLFREGLGQVADPTPTPWRVGEEPPPVEELSALVPAAAVADLRAVVRLGQGRVLERLRSTTHDQEVVVGPTFAGSFDVGGADADWLARGMLLDCKSTVRPAGVAQRGLYQLVCYALLDYDDAHAITGVGIYLARQGHLVSWPLEQVLEMLAGHPVDVAEVRSSLRHHLAA